MTTRFKISLAAVLAVITMATAAPLLMAAASAKASSPEQDQPPQGPGPGMRGPRGGPGMPGPRGGPLGFGPGFRELDLTDDQKTQLKSIADSHRDEMRAAGEKLRAARDGMQQLVEADVIDESAIRAKSGEIAAAEADMVILNAKIRKESFQVLTSEQQAKLKELRDARGGPRVRRPGQR